MTGLDGCDCDPIADAEHARALRLERARLCPAAPAAEADLRAEFLAALWTSNVWWADDTGGPADDILALPALQRLVAEAAEARRLRETVERCGCEASGRCPAAFSTDYGPRRCDLNSGHSGYHIRNDGCGRPEYHWGEP